MSALIVVLTLVLLAAVIVVVGRPLFTARTPRSASSGAYPEGHTQGARGKQAGKPVESGSPERQELEAAREAKYREIRDTELDYRTGKLSSEDYEAVDGALRAEAVEILDRLEALDRDGDALPAGIEDAGEEQTVDSAK
jgi:hypothetical protein